MEVKKIYHDDLLIAKALIKRDNLVTRKYFYQQCYPLFKSIYDNYYTDCACVKEFIDEIYVLALAFFSEITLAPISGSSSVADTTVPCTVMFCAFTAIPIIISSSVVRNVFFMILFCFG